MPFDTHDVTVTSDGDAMWRLERPLAYRGKWMRFVVPAGFLTDFATIPRVLTWLVKRTGQHTRAVVLHDWLVTTGIESGAVTHRDADAILRRVLRETGSGVVKRWLMWTGVRYGSLVSGRRDGWWRDAPAVAGITVLAAPLVVPPAVAGAAAWLVYRVVEDLARLLSVMLLGANPGRG